MKKNIFLFIFIFSFFLIFYIFYNKLIYDEIWTFGFGYNIAKGLVPYKDFNLIITPLYPLLSGIFLYIFGNNILIFLIFNSIISTSIIYLVKLDKKDYILAFIILLLAYIPNYNNLLLLLFYLIIVFEKKKDKDFLIGIVVSLLFFTKHNVGLFILLGSLLFINKEQLKKRIFGFLIPSVIIFLYLLINNCLFEFIDYTFLGIFSFAEKNTSLGIFFIIELIIVFILFKDLLKKKFKNKELLYILMFQSISFPIFDNYHVLLASFPFLVYYIPNNKNYLYIGVKSFIIIYLFFSCLNFKGSIPNNLDNLNYRMIDHNLHNIFIDNIKYIDTYKDDYSIFMLGSSTYLYKIALNMGINRYDIINYGNLGYNGHIDYINFIDSECSNKKCMFVINSVNSQTDKRIINYVKNNYVFKENINYDSIYTN